ncbi:Rpn family recombination-promoting nuclease/putative transposase [uncultured Parabacteroides sp.]|mgnify:FL=1|jgi:predicted transposase/invertase (TIGR01784 family)|uniref:Rpn family recombination-promoting nuclease/putative transposase n=1 Tax=uncultured Parabacteroides sp. TaxID=512312 RepID=UPI0025D26230|nr:Rpn family recombination-promoting nuclease/putative transposase [uncultured Parabacteroides sp.]
MATFINPFVDRGFKIIFGRDESKALLIDLLNDLFENEHVITDLSYLNIEMPADCTDSRTAIFDLKCKDKDGNFFIVEVQNAAQSYFYERSLYYLCRMICDQDKPGDEWKFSLCPVYGIFFLNFKSGKTDKVRTDIVLADRSNGRQASNLIRQIFLEMPFFDKEEAECENGLDYWLYTLKNMEKLETLPFKGQKALFRRLEELAKIVNLNKKERMEYEECLKIYRDNQNTWDYAIENGFKEGKEEGFKAGKKEGKEEGIKEGRIATSREIAGKLKAQGVDIAAIMTCTGLDADTIASL